MKKLRIFMVVAGLIFGVLAALLTVFGNPANMGLCAACFYRDIVGALGFHRAEAVQYIRPEIIGIGLGAFISALIFKDFRTRGGSGTLIRFVLGMFFMVGALVFLGCPVRAVLRLAGGDLNGITAILGIIAGVLIGIYFLKRGFNLGRATAVKKVAGWIMPLGMLLLLVFLLAKPTFIFFTEKGPGAMHAAVIISLVVGLIVGVLAQRTRMCFVGGWRDLFLVKDTYLFSGIAAFFVGALIVNLFTHNVHIGFVDQPIAHTMHIWNFLSMLLVGLSGTLLGGCPLRQTVLAAEGDTDAVVTILGLAAGAAICHNFNIAASAKGLATFSATAVIAGLIITCLIGFFMSREN